MIEGIFLICLALVWLLFATIQDLKKREVANWLNYSLIVFAIAFRFFYCLFDSLDFSFFYQGLIGLGIFYVLGHLFYYGRIFAGGDAKLMIALGAVLPLSTSFVINMELLLFYVFAFFVVGALYGLVISLFLTIKHFRIFKKEFVKQLKLRKKFVYLIMFLGLVVMGFGLIENLFFSFGIVIFILPYFYIYAKAIDECCMIKKIKTSSLTEGDWLYKEVKVGKDVIKTNWEGLSKQEIEKIRKYHKEVRIKQGIAFVPVFLISFLIFIYIYSRGYFGLLGIF